MLHQSLVDAFAPKAPPEHLNTRLLKNALSLPPSPDVSKLIAAALPLSGRSKVMGRYLQKAIMTRTTRLGPSDELIPILNCIPSEKFDRVIFLATQKFVKVLSDHTVDRNECIKRLICWLDDLLLFRPSIFKPDSSCALLLYPFLASRFTIAELGPHLSFFPPADAAITVLQNWIKPSILENPRHQTLQAIQSQPRYATLHYNLHQRFTADTAPRIYSTPMDCDIPYLDLLIGPLLTEQLFQHAKPYLIRLNQRYVNVASQMAKVAIQIGEEPGDLFQVLKHYKSPVWTYYFFAKLTWNDVHIPYPVAVDLMRYFINIRRVQWALDVFKRSQGRQGLSGIPELLFALIDSRSIRRSEVMFDLLNLPDYSNSLPMNLRSVAKNPLSQERVQLVHHVAYAVAKSPRITSRMAFRRVCDCLNYLEDRGAPLSSLMSRALVYSGVTRPLREGLWLSTEKFQWILPYVRRLEGDEVADSLDEAAFTLRSENLESNGALMKPLEDMERKADQIDWEYRKQFGHVSHRWKRTTVPYKLGADNRTRRDQARQDHFSTRVGTCR
ncbi:hypothetical protein KCU98_g266, partial [Aureobasidium melanogenum]